MNTVRTRGWGMLVLVYLYGVVSSASLSKAIPLQAQIGALPGAGPGSFALFMSIMTVLPALFGTVWGAVIDRIGARPALLFACVIGALVNGGFAVSDSIGSFLVLRVLEGIIPLCIYAAAPALMIAFAAPERRNAAMALWSTYTPVGTSLGLLIAAASLSGQDWRHAYLVHGALFVVMAALSFILPATPGAGRGGATRSIFALLTSREGLPPVRLSLAFGMLILLGLGMSMVFPPYVASHGVSLATASRILALANLLMILGSILAGTVLSRGLRPRGVFLGLTVVGCVAGIGVFLPQVQFSWTVVALAVWLTCTGAAMAVLAAQLPHVSTPAHRASAAGLLSQTGAILTFITPEIWLPALALHRWTLLALIVVVGWMLGALLMPGRVHKAVPA